MALWFAPISVPPKLPDRHPENLKRSFRADNRTRLRATRGQVGLVLGVHDGDDIAEVERGLLLLFESPAKRRGRFNGKPRLPGEGQERVIAGDEHISLSCLGEGQKFLVVQIAATREL